VYPPLQVFVKKIYPGEKQDKYKPDIPKESSRHQNSKIGGFYIL